MRVPVADLEITGDTNVAAGDGTQLAAIARMRNGTTADVTANASWASDNPFIQANQSGVVSLVGSVASLCWILMPCSP